MTFLELAKARYSVRKFKETPVEPEKLAQILEAAQAAPTAANFQPQRILVLQSKDALEKLKSCTPYHFHAPLALLVCYETSAAWERKADGQTSGWVDTSIIGTHIMMETADLGLGSTWVMAFDPDAVRKAYNVPDTLEPVAIFPIGYPADDAAPAPPHGKRFPLEQTVAYDTF